MALEKHLKVVVVKVLRKGNYIKINDNKYLLNINWATKDPRHSYVRMTWEVAIGGPFCEGHGPAEVIIAKLSKEECDRKKSYLRKLLLRKYAIGKSYLLITFSY